MAMPTRWNPFNPLAQAQPFLDFEDMFRGLRLRPGIARDYERTMDMRLDVNEEDGRYIVNIDVPGVRKDDIDISVDGNQVTVHAEVKREKTSGTGKEIYTERYAGQASRSFTLPARIDSNRANATYDGGVLTLTLPKEAGSTSRHLEVG